MVKQSRKIYLITGMHRSGTSLVAGILAEAGFDLGRDLLPANEANPKGYFEDRECVVLNELILRSVGRCWFDTRPIGPKIREEWRQRLASYLSQRLHGGGAIAVKDPRISRLLPFWADAFQEVGAKPQILVCIRNPSEVMNSLATRDKMPARLALALWWRHLVSVTIWLRKNPIPSLVVTFDELFDSDNRLTRVMEFIDSGTVTRSNAVVPCLRRSTLGPYGNEPLGPAHQEALELYHVIVREPSLERVDVDRKRLAAVDHWFPEWTTMVERLRKSTDAQGN